MACTLNRTGLGDFDNPPVGHDSGGDLLTEPAAAGGRGAGDVGGGSGESGAGGRAGANVDSGRDGGAPSDALTDAPSDALTDAPSDAPSDASSDASSDAPTDAPADQGGPDAAVCGASVLCDTRAISVTLPGGRFTGTTSGVSADRGTCGGGGAPEAVFNLILTQRSDVFITTHGTGFNTVVYMRAGCCGAEIGCNDNADGRTTSVLAARGLGAGSYQIFVDGATAGPGGMGPFTLDIYATPTSVSSGDNCGSPLRIANLPVSGTTCGLAADFDPLAGCLTMPAATGGDAVYYFVLDAPSTTVLFSTCINTCFDDALYVRDVCTMTASQRLCNDNFCRPAPPICPVGAPTQSRVTGTLGPGVHYLVMDTHLSGPTAGCGSYSISPTGVPP